jgi:hypothetical protein
LPQRQRDVAAAFGAGASTRGRRTIRATRGTRTFAGGTAAFAAGTRAVREFPRRRAVVQRYFTGGGDERK